MDWRERRARAYQINNWDDYWSNNRHVYVELQPNELVELIVEFFKKGSQLIYPAKSYFVAMVYAMCLEKYFDIPFWGALNYPDLLVDDKYFVTKALDSDNIYQKAVDKLGNLWQYSGTKKTIDYFKKEFLIDD